MAAVCRCLIISSNLFEKSKWASALRWSVVSFQGPWLGINTHVSKLRMRRCILTGSRASRGPGTLRLSSFTPRAPERSVRNVDADTRRTAALYEPGLSQLQLRGQLCNPSLFSPPPTPPVALNSSPHATRRIKLLIISPR